MYFCPCIPPRTDNSTRRGECKYATDSLIEKRKEKLLSHMAAAAAVAAASASASTTTANYPYGERMYITHPK